MTDDMPVMADDLVSRPVLRWGLIAFGWAMVTLAVIGIVVPGLPTTVFLIIAAWAFSRSSLKIQSWLWQHPRLGPPVRAWYRHRVIPLKGKVLAVITMGLSVAYMAYRSPESLTPPLLLVGVLLPIALYICTRASQPPKDPDAPIVDEW